MFYENPYIVFLIPVIGVVNVFVMVIGRRRVLKKIYVFRHTLTRYVLESFTKRRDYGWMLNVAASILIVSLITISLTFPYTVKKTYVEAEQTIKATLSIKRKIPVIIILDTSGSMEGDKIKYARETVKEFVYSTIDYVLIGFIAFSDKIKAAVPPVSNPDTVVSRVYAVKASGGTIYSTPLKMAYEWSIPYVEFNLTPIFIFVTDGLPHTPDIPRYRDIVYKCATHNITIYPIYIQSGSEDSEENRVARERLSEIAEVTRGELYTVDRAQDLIKIFKELANKTIARASTYILNTRIKFPFEEKHYVVQQYIFLAFSALVLYAVTRTAFYRVTI